MGALKDAVEAAEVANKWAQQSGMDQQRQMLQNQQLQQLIGGGLLPIKKPGDVLQVDSLNEALKEDGRKRLRFVERWQDVEPPPIKKRFDKMRAFELIMAIASLVTASVALAFSQGWI